MDEEPITRAQAEEIATSGPYALAGEVTDARLEGDPPVWIVTACTENSGENPWLANITILMRRLNAVWLKPLQLVILGDNLVATLHFRVMSLSSMMNALS